MTDLTTDFVCPGGEYHGKPFRYCPVKGCGWSDPVEPSPPPPLSIDAAHLAHQREWSTETFGPGARMNGVLDHIGKELDEIRSDPTDLSEWVDVLILAFDGAWRAGWEPQEIIDAIHEKQHRNELRTWPDWRTMSEDHAIEHDRTGELAAVHVYRGEAVEVSVSDSVDDCLVIIVDPDSTDFGRTILEVGRDEAREIIAGLAALL